MEKKDIYTGEEGFYRLMRKVVKFVRPFLRLLLLSVFLNALFSVFSAVTVTTIKPITKIIFSSGDSTQTEAVAPETTQANDVDFTDKLKDTFFKGMEDMILVKGDFTATLINLSIFIIFVFILKNLFKYWGTIINIQLQEGVIKSIRDKLFSKLMSLSVDYFEKTKEGTLISILTNDVAVVNKTAIMAITDTIREAIQVIIFLLLLLSISPYLTMIAFSTSVISLLILKIAVKYLRRYAKRMQTAMADYTSSMQESIAGIRVVKAYNAETTVSKRFIAQTLKYVKSAVKHRKIVQIIPSANEIFAIAALCVVLYVGGTQVHDGSLAPDDLFLFLFSLFSILSPIASVFNQVSEFQHGYISAQRVFSILNREPSVETGKDEVTELKEAIEFKNINFKYIDAPVIKNVSLTIPKNKKIAFVGASGSGKSTMLDLLIRFYDPVEGEITIDGKNIRELTLQSYRSLFGIVAQETILFNDTVANNIRFGLENATMEQVIEASKMANAYDFIMKLPDGFDTFVGDRGIMLSGGERQRVAIARALLRNPQILVFDEATSALDAESEKVVQEAINVSLRNRTAAIVAHRLSTIIDCDEIVVFEHGRIIERGTHSELIEQNGVYKKLCELQFRENG